MNRLMAVVINVPAVSRGTRECTRPSMCASGVPYRTRDKRCGVGGKSAATVRPVTSTPRVGSTIPSFFLRHEEGMVSERPPKSCRHAYRSSRSLKTSVCALVELFPPPLRAVRTLIRAEWLSETNFRPSKSESNETHLQPMIATETYTIRGREVFEPILVNSG